MIKINNISNQLDCPTIQIHSEEPSLPYLIDKITDLAIEKNQEACLVIAGAIATSIVFHTVAQATAKLIKAFRSRS